MKRRELLKGLLVAPFALAVTTIVAKQDPPKWTRSTVRNEAVDSRVFYASARTGMTYSPYEEFEKKILRDIATGLDLPYEKLIESRAKT